MRFDRNKQLAKDLVIYGLGNIGNKFLMFLLFPVLMFFMEPEELGSYDIPLEAVFFVLPIVTLQMRESIFRLLVDNNDESYRKHILSTTLFIEGIMFATVLVIAIFLPFFFSIRYFHLIILSIYAYSLYEIYLQAVRAVYSSTQYALITIINSVLVIVWVILFYFVFKRGVEGLFIGNILSRMLSILIIELPRRKILGSLSFRAIKKKYAKEILVYALPLLVSAVAFGIIASPGKYIVNYFYGDEANGIFAGAQKYVSILLIIGTAFYQAWQVTAIKNYKEHGSERFFSEVFNKYVVILCLLALCIPFGLRSFPFLMGPEFHQSIDLLYIYCVSSVFFGFSLFFETIYQCTKQTSKILYSIVSCAVFAPLITFFLTKYFGLQGSIAALTISYAYLFVFRFFQAKFMLPIRLKKEFYLSILLLTTGGIIFYCTHNIFLDYAVLFIATLLLLYFFLISRKYTGKKMNG